MPLPLSIVPAACLPLLAGTLAFPPACAAGGAAPASAAARADSTPVNRFVSYDAGAKSVSIRLIAALNGARGGFNFNGGSAGDQTISVPLGWKVHFDVRNNDAIPHSAIVIADQTPVPNAPDQPAFPGAYTAHLGDGLAPQTGHDTMSFVAATAGNYLIACGVPGHAPSGMYIRFVVSPTATAPSNTGTIAAGG